jgi:type II secretion system (T2SS) protein B
MSYILDALTKAAKQRDRQAPVLQRLLAPASTSRSAWTRSPRALAALLVLNVGLLAVLVVTWLRPVAIPSPPESVGKAVAPTSPPEQSLAPEPRPTPEARGGKAARREPDTVMATGPARPKRIGVEPPPGKLDRAPKITPAPPAVTPPVPPAQPPTAPGLAGLRLDALIYSDVPAERMIFVKGRKYVEGDTIEDRVRVEEIQEDGAALSEQGRRFTLRITR